MSGVGGGFRLCVWGGGVQTVCLGWGGLDCVSGVGGGFRLCVWGGVFRLCV